MSAITGWFSALVAQHMFVDAVPKPQRRSWNFVGSQWVIADDSANDRLDIALSLDFDEPLVFSPIDGEPAGFPDEGAQVYAQENTFELFTPDAHWTFTTSTIDAQAGIPTIDIDTGVHSSPVTRLALDGGNKLYLMAADEVRFGAGSASYGYITSDGSDGIVLRSDNVAMLRSDAQARIVGTGLTLEPDGIAGGGVELTISGGATLEFFAPSHDLRISSGSAKDVIINSGRDVILDHDTGRAVIFYENGVEFGRIAESSGVMLISGTDVTVSASDALLVEAVSAVVEATTIDFKSDEIYAMSASGVRAIQLFAREDDECGVFALETATSMVFGWADPQQIAATAGNITYLYGQQGNGAVGGKVVVGGGLGGTPGTHLAGGTDIDLGQPSSNASARLCLVTTNGVVSSWYQTAASSMGLRFGSGNVGSGATGAYNATVEGFSLTLNSISVGMVLSSPATVITAASVALECDGQFSSSINAVAYSATPTLNCNLSNNHTIAAMTGNITTLDMSNIRNGAIYTVQVTQDGSGGKTVGWAAKFIFGDTYSNVPDAAASAVTVWTFRSDGTNVRCIGKETY